MNALWIKICGMTDAQVVSTAVAAGVDAVGFVFAPSKRRVTAAQANALATAVPSSVARVAVMLHPAQAEVDEVLTEFRPDILQSDWQDFASLQLPQSLICLPVLRAGQSLPGNMPARYLYEGPVSGTGLTADWSQATQLARHGQLLLAGGLNPDNVAAAIDAVQPAGVDVSSGVERAPGIKDPDKIVAFVRAAMAAHAALDHRCGLGEWS